MRAPSAAAVLGAAACLLLAGCAPTVALAPAPAATSVGCASVVVGLPAAIAGAERRNTDGQGTAAWGTPASVTLRCGVRTPQISSLPCTTVDGVDWLLQDVDGKRVLTTYGRDPGVQLVTEPDAVSANDVLTSLSDTIDGATRATDRVCLSDPGASPSTTLTPTPSTTP